MIENDVMNVSGHPSRITVNVSGERYETFESTLQRFPKTLLANEEKRKRYFCTQRNEYFFNRNRNCFAYILFSCIDASRRAAFALLGIVCAFGVGTEQVRERRP